MLAPLCLFDFKSLREYVVKNHALSLFLVVSSLMLSLGCFDTAQAQNTPTANPSQLTFQTQTFVTTPSQTVLVTSNAPVSVGVTAVSPGNWLLVTPSGGATPLSLTVSIGPIVPATANVGFIDVDSPAGSVSILVTLNTYSMGPPPLSVSPNPLSFTLPANSSVPSSQSVSVSSSDSEFTGFGALTVSNGSNWLSLSPASGLVPIALGPLPGSFSVTVDPTALKGAGMFNAAIAVVPLTPIDSAGTATDVPVTVILEGTPSIEVTPSELSFGYQIGTAGPAAQVLSVSTSAGSNVGLAASSKTATCGGGWLTLSQPYLATPSSLTVSVNVSDLAQGTCTGEIDFTPASASKPSVVVPVSLLVNNRPLLQVPSTGPTFNYQLGRTIPAAQIVQITSTTPGVSFTAAATAMSGELDFLQVNPASGATPQVLELTVNPIVLARLANGTYTENVRISATGAGNSPQTFPLTLVVSNNPVLISSIPSLNFNYQIGEGPPIINQTVTITSSGAPVNYQVSTNTTECSGFLTATPASGGTFGIQNQIVVSVNVTGFTTSQACKGNVVLTVPGTSTQLLIPVTLNVGTGVLLQLGQSSVNVTALAGSTAAIQQTIPVTSSDNSFQPFTATAATSLPGSTWLSVAPNGMTLQITVNPTGLAIGVYGGSITIQGIGSAASAPIQTIPVTLTVSAITVTPTSLYFQQGDFLPSSQTLQIDGVPTGTKISASATQFNGSGTWLTTSVSGTAVTVSVSSGQLSFGTYNGVVMVVVPGAQGSPFSIPVTFTINESELRLLGSPATMYFSFQSGTQISTPAQTVQVNGVDGAFPEAVPAAIPFNVEFTSKTGGAFVSVTPTSGVTSASLSVALNAAVAAGLSPGNYSGTITVSCNCISLNGYPTVTVNLTVTPGGNTPSTGLLFVPMPACRVVDTRDSSKPEGFGPPSLSPGARSFLIPSGPCAGIPGNAQAYALNVTVVPDGPLGYVTVWPAGQIQPNVSTLNSYDGEVKANAAIVAAGTDGAVSVFATNDTDVVLDINGYFVPDTDANGLAFYPLTPCRVVDTRPGALSTVLTGMLPASSVTTVPILSGNCNVPATAQAYSLNFTLVPPGTPVSYLTVWPTGQSQPFVSTLNDPTGTVEANAGIAPAGTGGSIDVFVTDATDLVIDINGYFAPAADGGLSLYTLPPCRVLDTRNPAGAQPFQGTININVTASGCGATSAAQAQVFNATVVPAGPLGFLTLWPEGSAQPVVSTLNAYDGEVTSNLAIVPTSDTGISAYASDSTYLLLDLYGYFATAQTNPTFAARFGR